MASEELTAAQAERDEYRIKHEVACSTLELVKARRDAAQRALAAQCKHTKELEAERDELRAVLKRLYVACPTTLECRHFHHSKRERHSYIEPCGLADEYLEAFNQARAAIAKGEKNG